jgi:hypothetical protein
MTLTERSIRYPARESGVCVSRVASIALPLVLGNFLGCQEGPSAQALGRDFFDLYRAMTEQECSCEVSFGFSRDMDTCLSSLDAYDEPLIRCYGEALADSPAAQQVLSCHKAAVDDYIACIAASGCAPLPARFFCDDGRGILEYEVCDGLLNCAGGEDEEGCPMPLHCDGDSEIPAAKVCDGVSDCADGADEDACAGMPSSFACDNGVDIPAILVCDRLRDCVDGSDEADCPPTCESALAEARALCGEFPDSIEEQVYRCLS